MTIVFHSNKNRESQDKQEKWLKDVELVVVLKYLSNFWGTLEMLLINCEVSLQVKWSKYCFLVAGTAANQVPEIKITDTKFYVPVVTLSTEDNI